MSEVRIDDTRQRSKTVDELSSLNFDYVVTLCQFALEQCPSIPGTPDVIHAPFDYPPQLAKEARTEDEALTHFRLVRDQLGEFVEGLPERILRTVGQDS